MYRKKPVTDWKAFLFYVSLLTAFWLLMAPVFEPVYVVLGFLLAVAIALFWRQELFPPGTKLRLRPRQIAGLVIYLANLVYDVVLASLIVARIVLSRRLPISPCFVVLKTKLERDIFRVLYANSITLTPGTITIDMQGDLLLIHALTAKGARDIYTWYMQDMLRRIELNEP
ncbi:MAG: Na+/H+ antiporter subunit E [Dethiobacter sp.]|nr:Na+/H+ antiporter subunit E [Dethiobacter sp.]